MREHLKWKDETRKEKERLERQLEEAREERIYSELEREWLIDNLTQKCPDHDRVDVVSALAHSIEGKYQKLKEKGE